MDKHLRAQELVAELGVFLTIPGMKLDEATYSCVLLFQGDLVLNVEYDDPSGRLICSSYLGDLPDTGAEPLLRELMGANLFWNHTLGATLCLEESTNAVMLVYGHSVVDLDLEAFQAVVRNFVDQAAYWQARLAQGKPALRQPPAEPSALSGGVSFA
jgi:hypothetical protein